MQLRRWSGVANNAVVQRRMVLCRAAKPEGGLSVGNVMKALGTAKSAWDRADHDKNGTLSLDETVVLINSKELQESVLYLTNVQPKQLTKEELRSHFEKADADKSGCLSQSEFLALYLAVAATRARVNPLILAEALLGFIDHDRNGKIEGGELKVLLALVGFPMAMLLPIPSGFGVEYRKILHALGGGK